nr:MULTISPECIES: 30S ribosomal protein S9 [Actinoalloteichus]
MNDAVETPQGETVETPEAVEAEAVEAPEGEALEGEAHEGTDDVEVAEDGEAPVDEAFESDEEHLFEDEEAPVAFVSGPVQTVGRRKEAVVRVRLVPGSGEFKLNGKALEEYFPNKVHQQLIKEPLVTLEKVDAFDVFGNLHGGGTSGQAGALRLAIARALIEVDADDRPALKKAGFLTRDSRAKERKKYGLKKARKAPQYSKR